MSMIRPSGEDPATKLARTISRRRFLDRSLRGITTGAVAVFAGGRLFSSTAKAEGEQCPCSSPRGVECTDCPAGRKEKKCPDGYVRCRTVDGEQMCVGCVYEAGYWVSCTGLGEGFGYRLCVDCMLPGDCNSTCGCRSKVICRHCTSAADVKAEMALAMSGTE
jgi:hypothetical protein